MQAHFISVSKSYLHCWKQHHSNSGIVSKLRAQSSAGWIVPHSQRHLIANAETWADDRSGAWQQSSLVSQSHFFIAGSRTRVGKRQSHSAIASHWTAAACAVLPTFSSLSEDCGTYTMPCGGGEPIQMHSISDFGSENVQTRTETFPNMKILPVRITTDFFLNHLL
jgi:hypothetical protein